MGMTIEESMKVLQEVPKVMPITEESINVALDTMRKYQKIEEIVKNTQQLCSYGSAFIDIREVIEDGNYD